MKKLILTIILLLFFTPALAADELPEIMVGQTKLTVDPSNNQSVRFDGREYFYIENVVPPNLTDFTIMFWIKPSGTTSNQSILRYGRSPDNTFTNPAAGFALKLNYSTSLSKYKIVWSVGDGTSGIQGQDNTTGDYSVRSGVWSHVAFVKEGNQMRGYVNGNYVYGGTVPAGSVYNANEKLYIGDFDINLESHSMIDEVRLYDTDLKNAASVGNQVLDRADDSIDSFPVSGDNNLIGAWFLDGDLTDELNLHNGDNLLNMPPEFIDESHYESTGGTYYGGFTGNEVVYNHNRSGQMMGRNYAPSLKFDGINDYVKAPVSSPVTSSGDITVSLWIKPADWLDKDSYTDGVQNGAHWMMSFGGFGIAGNANRWIDIDPTAAYPTDYPEYGATYSRRYCNASNGDLNQWNFITIKYDHSLAKITNYLNGEKQNECGPTRTAPLHDIPIGTPANPVADDIYFNLSSWAGEGLIDEAKIFDKALSDAEVASLYKGNNVSTDELVGYWDFDEGEGSTISDKSKNNNSGTLYNFDDLTASWIKNEGAYTITDEGDLFGFNKSTLINCMNGIILNQSPTKCFVSNTVNSSVKIMNSRSFISNSPVTETAILYYPTNSVSGDVYGTLNNFAFWGRNLHQSKNSTLPSSDASWRTTGPINTNAQAAWGQDKFNKYHDKIQTLQGEAASITSGQLNFPTWSLQADDLGFNNQANTNDVLKYPEGKVWRLDLSGSATITRNITYKGKGTIIVQGGNLNFANGASLKPFDENSRLGIIQAAQDDFDFQGNNKIYASMFTKGFFNTLGDNCTYTGSFVASDFPNLAGRTNLRFFYDYGLDNGWPPGFRYLDMPHPSEN